MDTLQNATSIIEKEIANNLTFWQKEIDTRNTNNATVVLITEEDLNVKSLSANSFNDGAYHRADHRRIMRKHSRPRWDRTVPLKLSTLTTVENAHNTADTKYSVYPVAKIAVMFKDRRDSIRK